MALARFLSSRNSTLGRAANLTASFWLNTQHGISTSRQDPAIKEEGFTFRRRAQYTVFKGKAAMSMSPILPSIHDRDSRSFKNGTVMLTFWPAIGQRKYDWQKKQAFALSPTEVGNLIALGPAESCEFFHDPSMKSSHEGQINKSLAVSPMGKDSGYFLNLSVVNNVEKTNERFSVPVTKAEFTVIRTVLSYVLPHIMGWPEAVTPQPFITALKWGKGRTVAAADPAYEWEK